jgi:hypothetical protein
MLPHSRPADAAPFPPELPGNVLSLDLVRFGAGQDVADFLDQRAAVLSYGIGVPLVCVSRRSGPGADKAMRQREKKAPPRRRTGSWLPTP